MGPVAIGGVGGSGTRVVALIMRRLGFFMGDDLIPSEDNLSFTLLFNRPEWYARADKKDMDKVLRVFERSMTNSPLGFSDHVEIFKAVSEFAFSGYQKGRSRVLFPVKRAYYILKKKRLTGSDYKGWGWKEPNTQIFLNEIIDHFKDLKYIQVVRHGLDMAFSGNQNQFSNWGGYFGIKLPEDPALVPRALLEYWAVLNKRSIDIGKARLGDRFMMLNYDELCRSPREVLLGLLNFLGIDPKGVDIDELAGIPRVPSSMGRYKNRDLSVFSEDLLNSVRELGFSIEKKDDL